MPRLNGRPTAWQTARQQDTQSAYQAYLKGGTIKQYVNEAQKQLQAIEKAEAERAADSLANGLSTGHSVGLPSLLRRQHAQTIRQRGPKTVTSPRNGRS